MISQLDNITVVGGGTAGHLTTLFLVKNFPNKNIKWIFPEQNNFIGVGEATVPYVQNFLKELGIDIQTILRDMNGTLKLGIKFDGFFKETRYHPFGETLEESQLLLKYMKENKVPENILEFKDIASHMNVHDLYSIMYKSIQELGVEIIRREYQPKDNDNTILVDCTGFGRHIINKYLPNNLYTSDKIKNNKAIVARSKEISNEPYSTFTALDNGWFWKIPLKHETSYGYVFNDNLTTEEQALENIKEVLGDLEYKTIPMTTGRNIRNFAETNTGFVTSIGLSSFFIEPIESTGLYFVCYGLNLLKEVLDNNITPAECDEIFNKEFDNVVEFIIAHFVYSDNQSYDNYKDIPINKGVTTDIFPSRSWDYLLNQEFSEKKPPVNKETIKLLTNLKDMHEIKIS